MTDLARDVLMLSELANEIAKAVAEQDYPSDLGEALVVWNELADSIRRLTAARDDAGNDLAEDMPEKMMVLEGVGVFEKHLKKNRTKWAKDDLLRVVLDSRIEEPDPDTGEFRVREETPLEKVLDVYNLPSPRTTALKARGIDADEFCESEWAGWSIRLVAP
jgi:hypothetical protein